LYNLFSLVKRYDQDSESDTETDLVSNCYTLIAFMFI
jgi:hypothetical protein